MASPQQLRRAAPVATARAGLGGRFRAWQQRARCRRAIPKVAHGQSTRRQRPRDPAPASGVERAAADWATEPLRLTPIVSPLKATTAPQAAVTRFSLQGKLTPIARFSSSVQASGL